jgi:kynureninase
VILSTRDNFPTDLYIAQGLIQHLGGGYELRMVDGERIAEYLDDQIAVLMLTHVNYKTGRMFDLPALTQQAHACGALTLWDLAHSAGAIPVDLNGAGVDFAVGCGYKYLNGGPGAPAYLFVARQWQPLFSQPLSGWMGHTDPFAFTSIYEPAPGIGRYLCGTPPILSMAALESGVDLLLEADMQQVRAKSLALTDLFIHLIEYALRRVWSRTCDPARSRHPRESGQFPSSPGVRPDAGVDCCQCYRRLPRARYCALRVCAALPPLCRCLGRS